jgi:DNA polymerase-3 subunit alpha
MQMPEIMPPKLPPCNPWQLVEQLDFEKEVTGMYMSGHPLDNFKFELKHYNITSLSDFNAVKALINETPNTRAFRLAGLVIDAQHRLTKAGKKFCALHLEDFSGKTEFMIWSEEYVKYVNWLEKGMILFIEGGFKQRFNTSQYEFKISRLYLLDTVKKSQTKQVILDVQPQFIDQGMIDFLENNIQKHPGATSLKINILDMVHQKKLTLSTIENGIELNDDLIEFLHTNKHIEVSVNSAS